MECAAKELATLSVGLESYRLDHKSNTNTLMYLMFVFIVTNDNHALKLLLNDLKHVPMEIKLDDIYQFEEAIRDGILKNQNYKKQFELSQEIMSKLLNSIRKKMRRLSNTNDFPKDTLNFLLLACVIGNVDIVTIIIDRTEPIPEYALYDIICDHDISSGIMKILVIEHSLIKSNEAISERAIAFFSEALQRLTTLHSFADEIYRATVINKLYVIDSLIDIGCVERIGFNVFWWELYHPAMEEAILRKDSILFNRFFGRYCYVSGRTRTYKVIRENEEREFLHMLHSALSREAYFIIYIMFTTKRNMFSKVHVQICNIIPDIFSLQYLLKHGGRIELDIIDDLFLPNNSLALWLVLCYAKTKQIILRKTPVWARLIKINVHDNPTFVMTFSNVLMGLGLDIDYESPKSILVKTPLIEAIKSGHTDLVRLLIYHGCNVNQRCFLDRPTDVVFWNAHTGQIKFNILKSLLLSGAEISSYRHKQILQEQINASYDEMQWLKTWLQNPTPLKYICRKTLRNAFGRRLQYVLDQSEYPSYLKDFITTKILY